MRRLRLLWVTPDLPLRGVTASRERWWALLARLTAHHDVSLVTFVDPQDAAVTDGLPPGLARIDRVPKRPWVPDDPLALLPASVRGGFSDPALRTAVAARLAAERFDVVQYEWIEMAHVMPPSPVPAVLSIHQLGFAKEGPRWRADGRRLTAAPAALFRYARDLDWELRAVGRASHVVTMTDEDAARLRRFLPDLRVTTSPIGVDCADLRPPPTPPPIEADLLFVGNFVHPPNIDAVRFLVDEVVPRIGRAVRVRIAGGNAPQEIAALARPGIDVVGPVPDLRAALAAAAVVVAPVRFGTGMRAKVLDGLAMARPVVTTSLGAEGLGATPGRQLLVADGAAAFAAAVRSVLDDPALARRLGAEGRALAEARFDWSRIADAHEEIYAAALATPAVAAPPPLEPAWLRRTLGRLGWAPALASGVALVALRALRRHASPRRTAPTGIDSDRPGGRRAA
jgi:glycosyltransferase involved in cell wall biosynthesis